MASKNDITGDSIHSKTASDAFRNNFDKIVWGKKNDKKDNPAAETVQSSEHGDVVVQGFQSDTTS